MTRSQKRRRKCSKDNASASAVDSTAALRSVDLNNMTRSQKRSKCSKDNASASAVDSAAASASVVDSRLASWDKGAASAEDSRIASEDNGAASRLDARAASQDSAPSYGPDSKEDVSASVLGSRPVSPFEFSVTSEEGINLYVDLTSSWLDWHKKLKNHMGTCQCVEDNKSQSFREQLLNLGNSHEREQGSFGLKSEDRIEDSKSSFVSSPHRHSQKGDDRLLSQHDTKGPYRIFAPAVCSSALEDSNCLEEYKKNPASTFNSGVISCTRTGKKEDYSSRNLIGVDHGMETGAQELAKFSGSKSHTHSNILAAEGKVIDEPVNETETSCKSGKILSNGGRRRKGYKSKVHKTFPQFSSRILRSAMRPRRSQRLFSKVVPP